MYSNLFSYENSFKIPDSLFLVILTDFLHFFYSALWRLHTGNTQSSITTHFSSVKKGPFLLFPMQFHRMIGASALFGKDTYGILTYSVFFFFKICIMLNLLGFFQWFFFSLLSLCYTFSCVVFHSTSFAPFAASICFCLSLSCVFLFLSSRSAVLRSFTAYTSVFFSCFFLSLPNMLSILSICTGVSEIPSEAERPHKEKNLFLSNKPSVFFLKPKNSGQRAFPCTLLLLPSLTVGLCWNWSSLSILWHVGGNSLYPGCCSVCVTQLKKWCKLLRLGRALRGRESASLLCSPIASFSTVFLAWSHTWRL